MFDENLVNKRLRDEHPAEWERCIAGIETAREWEQKGVVQARCEFTARRYVLCDRLIEQGYLPLTVEGANTDQIDHSAAHRMK